MMPLIAIHKLTKQYNPPKGTLALNEVDLDIQAGEIVSLLGPNGAGKTTLIAILCGLFPPTSGEVTIAGYDIRQNPLEVKQIIGVVPEEIALYPQLTGRQNLRYFGLLYGLEGQALREATEEVLSIVELTDWADSKVSRYSNGMKRRLNIAVGLLHHPRILLMDEPTLGLDPQNRRSILNLVKRLRQERGVTLLYTTHYIEEAQEISDRIAILHHGQVLALGTLHELMQRLCTEEILFLKIEEGTITEDALRALQQVKDVQRVSLDKDAIILSVRSAIEVLPTVLEISRANGIRVRTLATQQPDLETVFLHLTGERLDGTLP